MAVLGLSLTDLPGGGRYGSAIPVGRFDVVVVFTDLTGTLGALRTAAKLAAGLHARIRLLAPQVVPYPLSLEQPVAHPAFLANRFQTIVARAAVETIVDVRLCRDYWDAVRQLLKPRSTVVLGGRRGWWNSRWWPTREERLVKRLRAEGHHAIFVDTK